ncbi:hypothetical protein HanIR_Chr01g0012591 [Helianthus annuus]|nr:hypothetical protein HanIR_Chr01g0012591 [Helianthus annuus]
MWQCRRVSINNIRKWGPTNGILEFITKYVTTSKHNDEVEILSSTTLTNGSVSVLFYFKQVNGLWVKYKI